MGLYKKIKELSDDKKISIRQLEEKMEYGNGTIRRWEDSKPSVDKVQKVADYFDVSVDYLLGREKTNNISNDLDDMLDSAMSYDGKPMTDHDREIIRAYLEGKFGK